MSAMTQDALSRPIGQPGQRLELTTLGRLDIRRGGKSLLPSGKAPRLPIALMLHLVAGGTAGVQIETLVERLWPSDDAAGAGRLKVVLHRLRRVLGLSRAIVARGSGLCIDPLCVKIDAWEFERLAVSPGGVDPTTCGQALALYAGPFVADFGADSSLLIYEQHLEGRFAAILTARAERLVEEGRDLDALEIARQGLLRAAHDTRLYDIAISAAERLGRGRESVRLAALATRHEL